MTVSILQFTSAQGARPAGACALGLNTNQWNFQPSLADVSFSNTGTTRLYNGVYGYANSDASHYTTSNGYLAMQITGDDSIYYANLCTQMNNSQAGLLPYLAGNFGFYSEVKARLTSYTSDAHMAIWMMPQQHNLALSDTLTIPPAPAGSTNFEGWVEIDTCESSFGTYEQVLNTLYYHSGVYYNAPGIASASQTVANPGVFTTANQSFTAGECVQLTGTAPGGFALNTTYFVIAAGLTSTTCQLSATAGGAGIQCTSSAACTIKPLTSVTSASQSVANPGVFTTANQSFAAGTCVQITGTAPGGFALYTPYFILSTGLTNTTCQLGLTPAGPGIQCTSSASCALQTGYINTEYTNTNTNSPWDYTVAHRYGAGYNPATSLVTYWVDDIFVCSHSVAGFEYAINPYNWYQNISVFSRGANTPYLMEVQNLSAWTP